jgi:hypothetical protein
MKALSVLTLIVVSLSAWLYAADVRNDDVDYPDDYRKWSHVKSMVLQEAHPLYKTFGGIHHVYANSKALQALKAGKPYPDGFFLVFDLLEAKTENNAIVEGTRKRLDVMQKDSKRFAETAGWGYGTFKGDTRERVVQDVQTACHACHDAQKDRDYVFSTYRK